MTNFDKFRRLIRTTLMSLTIVLIGSHAASATEMAKVLRVVDGSTVIVSLRQKEKAVRLLGVTPPSASADPRFQKLARLSRDFLNQLTLGGWVYLELDRAFPSPDQRGNLVAYVYRQDGVFLNERMISEGYASCACGSKFQFAEQFRDNQIQAAKSLRGLWGNADSRSANWGSQAVSGQPTSLDDTAPTKKADDTRKIKSKSRKKISIAN